MPECKITLEEILEFATKAKDYARGQIIKGSSQLENNNLSPDYFDFLKNGMGEAKFWGLRDQITLETQDKIAANFLGVHPDLLRYESTIAVTSKYSLGNCEELAIQALDYILNNSDIRAEVLKIEKGDHAFLVLNRDSNSYCFAPETWGENAVICDPWANKAYRAADYLIELKSFGRFEGKNCLQDFNPAKHLLSLYERHFSTSFLRRERLIRNLKEKYWREGIFKKHKETVMSATRFSEEDQTKLFLHRGTNLKTQFMRFFGIKSNTQVFLEDAVREVERIQDTESSFSNPPSHEMSQPNMSTALAA